jgi:cholesterol transport system auxiliary component
MNLIATYVYSTGSRGLFLLAFLALAGCALPTQPVRPVVYDFGPGTLSTPPTKPAPLAPLAVAEIEANTALDTTAMLYRLTYADDQQLRAYAQARWSMTPAQLVRQRLREHLGRRRTLLNPGEGSVGGAATPLTLRIELEEFSQLFESPDKSVGLLRLRATVVQASTAGEKLVAQQSVIVQRPAPSADAPGGVRAMTAATDAAVQELDQWVTQLRTPGLTP